MLESPEPDEFTAPAGSLTLLFVSGWPDRKALLDLLATSRHTGLDELVAERDEQRAIDPRSGLPNARTLPPGQADRLAFVARTLERWLSEGDPSQPSRLRDTEAIVSMACGWSTAVTHAMAWGPQTITELHKAAPAIYDEDILVEHVEALERTGQARNVAGDGKPRYALTRWGMEAIAPLIAAARYEINHPGADVMAPEILDAEATFQLAAPLIELPTGVSGSCHMSVRLPGEERLLAGATVEARGGRIASSSILLEREPETWVTGSPLDWVETVVNPSRVRLEIGGNTELAGALLSALHGTLFDTRDG